MCTFGRKRDNFKIGIQSVIHLYGIFSGLNTKKQENQGFRKNGWFPFAPTRFNKKRPSQDGLFLLKNAKEGRKDTPERQAHLCAARKRSLRE